MMNEHGSLSINSENIFPIIKKWLYSDHDIFFREIISNGSDAITKLKKLELMGEVSLPEDNKYKIEVIVNPEEKTLKFIDNGIGMTADEVKEYINQIAFSGATDFLNKYKDKANEEQIIGHFGLGFYSAFMVAGKVTIDTLSWQEGADSVHWESEGGTEFAMEPGDREERGTEITLFLNEDSYEFSNEYRAKEVIEKYCSFMPVEIFFKNANAKEEPQEDLEEDLDKEESGDDIIDAAVDEDGNVTEGDGAEETEDGVQEEKKPKGPQPINNTTPLWTKHPNDVTEEEYKEFYRNVFHDYKEPLFWIHLNMDYPFNLKGILYFPKLNTEYDTLEGTIKLYSNQVFIADNIKEVIPEFLMLLKGAIDCPDLPLNVSRSALQNDGFVKKISEYISKKVADKLSGMYKVERESYEKFWDDISPFIKFGCLKDDKFREKMKEYIIFKNLEGKYVTLPEYVKAAKGETSEEKAEETKAEETKVEENASSDEASEKKEEKKDIVYYVTNEQQQSQYINLFKQEGIDALILTHNIDQPFITQLEQSEDSYKFQRIDADITDSFQEDGHSEEALKEETDELTELFRKTLNKEKLEVKVLKLKNEKVSSMITLSEESRRMQDMMKMYNMYGMDPNMFGSSETLVLNANNKLVQYIFEQKDSQYVPLFCSQLYDLALLSHKPLEADAMTNFISRSNEIMEILAK
ncbi:molecular chaperone HtpG [Anaerocolumna jejuensis DSM 15929]|uniref:Molecular chaperone HtpG n=1 Tax=Anaerocolumna jejuensis DSM 15929 TaxID=1121322 RepID=A0A1M6M9Z1_9FIRM|nr:molecular chaperone HtpG [Anaerocolumna jejuensis]SHJ80306.1 molecular chaperone HtpG [Anaerocolumna jejuensis DSM 15929]